MSKLARVRAVCLMSNVRQYLLKAWGSLILPAVLIHIRDEDEWKRFILSQGKNERGEDYWHVYFANPRENARQTAKYLVRHFKKLPVSGARLAHYGDGSRIPLQSEAAKSLQGDIRIDDVYLGEGKTGGKAGRGSENKVVFVAAVEMRNGRPQRVRFDAVAGFTFAALRPWAQEAIILWTVRWYCKYVISFCELQEMLAERGVNVDLLKTMLITPDFDHLLK